MWTATLLCQMEVSKCRIIYFFLCHWKIPIATENLPIQRWLPLKTHFLGRQVCLSLSLLSLIMCVCVCVCVYVERSWCMFYPLFCSMWILRPSKVSQWPPIILKRGSSWPWMSSSCRKACSYLTHSFSLVWIWSDRWVSVIRSMHFLL